MSELTICYTCGGRTYEHRPDCRMLVVVAEVIDELTYGARNDFIGSRIMSERVLASLQERGVIAHFNDGECYIGDRLVAVARTPA